MSRVRSHLGINNEGIRVMGQPVHQLPRQRRDLLEVGAYVLLVRARRRPVGDQLRPLGEVAALRLYRIF